VETAEKIVTTLFLVRHGETEDNVNQIMQGQTQGRLTERGVEQARELAERMRHEQIDAFFASDLQRSIDTCRIIAQPHRKTVQTTPLLRERDWGGFTGLYIPDLKDRVWPDDIETSAQMN
jgi:probable phosphoglycerate mutase